MSAVTLGSVLRAFMLITIVGANAIFGGCLVIIIVEWAPILLIIKAPISMSISISISLNIYIYRWIDG